MQPKLWDEGMSWSCLPHAVSSLICTGAAIINEWWICGVVGTLSSVLFFTARTGLQWQRESRSFRSSTGWMIAGAWIGWGRWRILPNEAQLSLDHTKETLMNRRGAYDVGIESWELMWHQKNGVVRVLHDFTDREMAQDVLQEITNLDSPI